LGTYCLWCTFALATLLLIILSPFLCAPTSFGFFISVVSLRSCMNNTTSYQKPPLAVVAPSYLQRDQALRVSTSQQPLPQHLCVQPTQDTIARNPTRDPFQCMKFTHTMHDASSTSVALESPPSTSKCALFEGEHRSPLWVFVGCHRAMLILRTLGPITCFYLVYHICKLYSHDIYVPT